ncbi:MAG: hypothetical protein ABI658_23390 [Acidimicrobiales bacterium]
MLSPISTSVTPATRPATPEQAKCADVAAELLRRSGPAAPPVAMYPRSVIVSRRSDGMVYTVDAVSNDSCIVFTSTYHWSASTFFLHDDVLAWSWQGGSSFAPRVGVHCRSMSSPRTIVEDTPVVVLYDPAAGSRTGSSGFVPSPYVMAAWKVDDQGFVALDTPSLQCRDSDNIPSSDCSAGQLSALQERVGRTFSAANDLGASVALSENFGADNKMLRLVLIDDCMVALLTSHAVGISVNDRLLLDVEALPA